MQHRSSGKHQVFCILFFKLSCVKTCYCAWHFISMSTFNVLNVINPEKARLREVLWLDQVREHLGLKDRLLILHTG